MSIFNWKTLRRAIDSVAGPGLVPSDDDLLEAYCKQRSTSAYAAMMDRYGSLVLRPRLLQRLVRRGNLEWPRVPRPGRQSPPTWPDASAGRAPG